MYLADASTVGAVRTGGISATNPANARIGFGRCSVRTAMVFAIAAAASGNGLGLQRAGKRSQTASHQEKQQHQGCHSSERPAELEKMFQFLNFKLDEAKPSPVDIGVQCLFSFVPNQLKMVGTTSQTKRRRILTID